MIRSPDAVNDTHLNEDIPFSNPSDAKIARLALSHDVPVTIIDLFLEVLHDIEFRSDQITFRSGFDIFQHVADYRAKRAAARAIRQLQEEAPTNVEDVTLIKSSLPLPQIVLDLVMDKLKTQYAIAIRNVSSAQHVMRSTLSSMTLVHRSCTLPAQRALGFALRLVHKDGIRRALCSPLFGSWTKRAYFLYGGSENRSRYHSQTIAGETHGFIAVHDRMRSLEKLAITFKAVRDDDILYAEKHLEGISKLSFLRELVVDVEGAYHLLSKSFSVLPELRKLVSFTVICHSDNARTGYRKSHTAKPELYLGLTPSHTLTHVCFVAPAGVFKEVRPFVEWLTHPREGFSVQTLCMQYSGYQRIKFEELMPIVDAIRPALPNLLSLELHAFFPPDGDEAGGGDTEASMNVNVPRAIMQACNSLRRIAICNLLVGGGIPRYFYDAFPLAPPTLQEIFLNSGHSAEFYHGEYRRCKYSRYLPTDSTLDTTSSTNDK